MESIVKAISQVAEHYYDESFALYYDSFTTRVGEAMNDQQLPEI